jgi:hypothetical protein
MFTLEDAECLALCGNAPCLTVNWRFFGDVELEQFDALVDDLRAGRLADEVPPHGTLNRVPRTVGLTARKEDGDAAAPAPHPTVDLETHRTTAAVASMDAAHLGDAP